MTRANSGCPYLSVCIPSFNAAQTVGETIPSILDVAYRDLEVIVNDNVSNDNTRAVVEGFDDPRLQFFCNETNLGPARNWNRAVKRRGGGVRRPVEPR